MNLYIVKKSDFLRYRLDVETKSGDLSWRCSAKGCKARVRIDAGPSLVIQQKNDHNHDPDDRGNERLNIPFSASFT
jgi:hypothetical protein